MLPVLAALAVALAASAAAFDNTVPILAYSSAPAADLRSLGLPSRSIFKNAQFPLAAPGSSPLCPTGPSSLLVVTSPALTLDAVPSGIKDQFNRVGKGTQRIKKEYADVEVIKMTVRDWKHECEGQVVIEQIDSLDQLHSTMDRNMNVMSGPLLILLSTISISEFATPLPFSLSRRQLPSSNSFTGHRNESHGNSTMPSHHAGVFQRYTFISPSLIIMIAIFVGILLPVVWLGSLTLTTIDAPRGLLHKSTDPIMKYMMADPLSYQGSIHDSVTIDSEQKNERRNPMNSVTIRKSDEQT